MPMEECPRRSETILGWTPCMSISVACPCRWGDYGGATPDPAASLSAANGEVWLTNQWTTGGSVFASGDQTWNWEARP